MQKLSGILLVLLSSTAFGITPLFAHLAYASGVDAITILWIRFSLTAIVLWSILILGKIPLPQPRHCLMLFGLGSLVFVGQSLGYFVALTLIPASLVALLLYLYPAIVMVLAIVFLKEPLTRIKLLTLALATTGVVLTVGINRTESLWGVVVGFGTAILYAVYVLLMSQIVKRQGSVLPCLTWVMSGACLMYSGLVCVRGAVFPQFPHQWTGWLAILSIALICTVLAPLSLFEGIKRIGATTGSTLSTWEPVVTVITAAIFLGEKLSPLGLFGGGLILLAVFLTGRSD